MAGRTFQAKAQVTHEGSLHRAASGERRRRSFRALVAGALLCSGLMPVAVAPPSLAVPAAEPVAEAQEIRSLLTAEFGVRRPTGLTYLPQHDSLLVAGNSSEETEVLRLTPVEDRLGTLRLPELSHPSALAFDGARDRLTGVNGHRLLTVAASDLENQRPSVHRTDVAELGLRDPTGATFDPATGTWFILDDGARALVRVPMSGGSPGSPVRISVRSLSAARLQGIALNPVDGLLYVASPERDRLYGLSRAGEVRKTYSLADVELLDLRAMVFAPSSDPTDDPDTVHLFMADSGGPATLGRVAEVTLAAETAVAAPVVTPTLVQTINTSQFSPPSPDPAGITYMPGPDHLMMADSEVDEMGIFQGVNLFKVTRTGSLIDRGLTTAFTREPTGLGFDPATGNLYISSDSGNKVFINRPGADGRYGTSDDQVSTLTNIGSTDAEGIEYDTNSGHLFVADGVGREIYDINPVNGTFGDGNDIITHFDVEQYGVRDPEGIGFDAARNIVIVMDRQTRKVFELTTGGALVRTIDTSNISGIRNPAGVTLAPATNNPGRLNYWIVDRQVDNGVDPNENDGKLYEVSVPVADSPPTVTLTSPAAGSTVSGTVVVQANASDDNGLTQVQFFDGSTSIGTDTNGADGWSVSWNTTAAANGPHTIIATATDTIGQTGSHSVGVTVSNDGDTTPPTVAITSPSNGATVSLTVPVQASASDNQGVASVSFFVDGASIGTDTNGVDGWSVLWNTTGVTNGNHTLTAAATDAAGNTGNSAPVVVTVNDGAGGTLDISVAVGGDDVEERNFGRIWPANSDLDLVNDGTVVQKIGLRFTGVTVPRLAGISNAYVQFQADEASSDATSLTIQGQAADNAAQFTTTRSDVSSRPRTSASVAWTPAAWTAIGQRGVDQRTPNLAPVLQEIINRPGWSSGNALVFIITGSGRRVAESFEGSFAPVLHVEFVTG